MVKHHCENYETFEDWFLNWMDADQAETIRDYGAGCGVIGLTNWSDISALFERFGSEIEEIATDALGIELWQIAKVGEICSVNELITLLVHAAAEQLAHTLKYIFDLAEDQDEDELDEGGAQ